MPPHISVATVSHSCQVMLIPYSLSAPKCRQLRAHTHTLTQYFARSRQSAFNVTSAIYNAVEPLANFGKGRKYSFTLRRHFEICKTFAFPHSTFHFQRITFVEFSLPAPHFVCSSRSKRIMRSGAKWREWR